MSTIAENAITRHRLTVEEFHRMGEAGIFLEDDRVELIDGEIIDMAPIGSKHAAIVTELSRLFVVVVEARARVWIQNPIRLGGKSELQPDVALLRPRDDRYAAALPIRSTGYPKQTYSTSREA
ncbi:MAG: Uma2 family endonuclease [Gammaproteobacteria bacterium]